MFVSGEVVYGNKKFPELLGDLHRDVQAGRKSKDAAWDELLEAALTTKDN